MDISIIINKVISLFLIILVGVYGSKKKIINEEYVRNAYKNLELKYFSIHWRIFYFFIKNKMSFCSYLMLSTIEFLRAKI